MPLNHVTGGLFRTSRKLWTVCAVVLIMLALRAAGLVLEVRREALSVSQADTAVVGDVLGAETSRYLQLVDAGLQRIQVRSGRVKSEPASEFRAQFGGADMHDLLLELLNNLPQANAFLVIGADGKLVNTTRNYLASPADFSGRDYFMALSHLETDDMFVSPPSANHTLEAPAIVLARRLVGADGQFAGVVAALLDASYFQKFYQNLNMGRSRGITLLRRDGTMLVRFPQTVPNGGALVSDKAFWDVSVAGGGGTFVTEQLFPGTSTIVSVHPLAEFPLVINVSLREDEALAPWAGLIRIILIQATVAALAVAFLFYVMDRQLKRQREQHTALEQAAAALRESELRLRAYAEMASDWFWEQDAELRFTWTSDTSPLQRVGKTSNGLTRWDLVGASAEDPVWKDHIAELRARRPFRDFRYERVGAGGDIRHVSINGAPVFKEQGQFAGYRGTGRDVTQEVAAERDQRDARDRAEAANRAKSEFLANMSHELRTPLNAIIGFSELIVMQPFGKVEDRYVDFGRDILASGKHLLDLINDLLDMSKIEAGQFDLSVEQIDMPQLVESCVHMVMPRATDGKVTLSTLAGPERLILRADRRAVRQVLLNLLSNAVKFTPEGGAVSVQLEPKASGGVALVVRDTGIGMDAVSLERLCEPFQQLDASISRRFGGTGLGLAITRKLMLLHGGELVFDSEPGQGTTVRAVFPAERVVG